MISKTKRPYSETKLDSLLWEYCHYLERYSDEQGNKWRVRDCNRNSTAYNCRNLKEVQSVLLALKEQQELKESNVDTYLVHNGYEWVTEIVSVLE